MVIKENLIYLFINRMVKMRVQTNDEIHKSWYLKLKKIKI